MPAVAASAAVAPAGPVAVAERLSRGFAGGGRLNGLRAAEEALQPSEEAACGWLGRVRDLARRALLVAGALVARIARLALVARVARLARLAGIARLPRVARVARLAGFPGIAGLALEVAARLAALEAGPLRPRAGPAVLVLPAVGAERRTLVALRAVIGMILAASLGR